MTRTLSQKRNLIIWSSFGIIFAGISILRALQGAPIAAAFAFSGVVLVIVIPRIWRAKWKVWIGGWLL
jgi:hypothetical protein